MASEKLWSDPLLVRVAPNGSREPTAVAVNDTLHVIYAADKALYHTSRAGEFWTEPTRVAAGEQPSLAVTADGRLHCLFVNEFAGNHEVYYVTWDGSGWSLPQAVSRTSGDSFYPALAAGADGVLHATWVDMTPGYPVVYYGSRGDGLWTSLPVPNARGAMPALTVHPGGDVYLAWQTRPTGTDHYDVLCAVNHNGTWELPQNVSDSSSHHSLFPRLAITDQGECQVVWQEEQEGLYGIRTAIYREGGWTIPRELSASGEDARLARVANSSQGFLQAAWLQGPAVCHRVRPSEGDATWFDTETVRHGCLAATDLSLVLTKSGIAHLIWTGLDPSGTQHLYHAWRQPVLKPQVLQPGQG